MAQPFRLAAGRPHRPQQADRASASTAGPRRPTRATRSPRALLANGIHLVGALVQVPPPARHPQPRHARSRTRCSRSIAAAGRVDPNNRAHDASRRSTASALASQNHWPSLGFDIGAVNDAAVAALRRRLLLQDLHVAARLLGASSTSRRSAPQPASAGRPTAPDPDRYQHRHAHCDVLVVGAGPAGLAAALAASESGKRVIARRRAGRDGRRAPARRRPPPSTASRRWDWLAEALADARRARERHAAAAHHGVRLLQPQPRRPGCSASPTTCARPARRPAARAAVAGARRARSCWRPARTSARSSSPTTTGPASCWPRACAPTSTATAWRRGGAS